MTNAERNVVEAIEAIHRELIQLRAHHERYGWHSTVTARRVDEAIRIADAVLTGDCRRGAGGSGEAGCAT